MKYAKQLFVAAAWQQLLSCSATDADTDTNTRYRYTYTFHSSSSVQCICLRIVSRFLYFFGHVSVVYLSQPSSLFAAFFFSVFFVSSFSISSISYYCLCLVLLKQACSFVACSGCCFVSVAVALFMLLFAVCCCHCPRCTLLPSAHSTWMKFPATALNNHNNRYFFMQLFAFCLLSAF